MGGGGLLYLLYFGKGEHGLLHIWIALGALGVAITANTMFTLSAWRLFFTETWRQKRGNDG